MAVRRLRRRRSKQSVARGLARHSTSLRQRAGQYVQARVNVPSKGSRSWRENVDQAEQRQECKVAVRLCTGEITVARGAVWRHPS